MAWSPKPKAQSRTSSSRRKREHLLLGLEQLVARRLPVGVLPLVQPVPGAQRRDDVLYLGAVRGRRVLARVQLRVAFGQLRIGVGEKPHEVIAGAAFEEHDVA